MKSAVLSGSIVLSLVAAGAVLAQNATPTASSPTQSASPNVDFSSLDRNKDGRISSAEATASADLNTDFRGLDSNNDSYLSAEEFGRWSKGKAKMPSDSTPSPSPAPSPDTLPGRDSGAGNSTTPPAGQ